MNKFLQFAIQLIKDRDHDNLCRLDRSTVEKAITDVLADCVTRIHSLEERLAYHSRLSWEKDAELSQRIEALEKSNQE